MRFRVICMGLAASIVYAFGHVTMCNVWCYRNWGQMSGRVCFVMIQLMQTGLQLWSIGGTLIRCSFGVLICMLVISADPSLYWRTSKMFSSYLVILGVITKARWDGSDDVTRSIYTGVCEWSYVDSVCLWLC